MKSLFILFIVFLFTATPQAGAVPPESNAAVNKKIAKLIEQLDQFEKKQQDILKHQDETLQEIKNLKIQARQ